MPPVQLPSMHSELATQIAPGGCGGAVHTPAAHQSPGAQTLSDVHAAPAPPQVPREQLAFTQAVLTKHVAPGPPQTPPAQLPLAQFVLAVQAAPVAPQMPPKQFPSLQSAFELQIAPAGRVGAVHTPLLQALGNAQAVVTTHSAPMPPQMPPAQLPFAQFASELQAAPGPPQVLEAQALWKH
jgi:hypothetical protein